MGAGAVPGVGVRVGGPGGGPIGVGTKVGGAGGGGAAASPRATEECANKPVRSSVKTSRASTAGVAPRPGGEAGNRRTRALPKIELDVECAVC